MKKYLAVLVTTGLVLAGLTLSSSAYFTHEVDTQVSGHTGYVHLNAAAQVNLPRDMQPGHSWVRTFQVHNDGKCPVRIWITLVGVPSFLRVTISPTYIPNLNYCNRRTITLRVEILSSITNWAQNKPVAFKIHFLGRNN